MPSLILQTHSSESSGETFGFDVAVLPIDGDRARLLLRRIDLVHQLHEQDSAVAEVSADLVWSGRSLAERPREAGEAGLRHPDGSSGLHAPD